MPLIALLCLAEILSMTPFSMFLALQPQLQREWALSNTASGWISSAYFTGYMVAVPVLASLTDRVDARAVWLGACGLAGFGCLGFATLATGPSSAFAMQLVAGAGLAGTYMPGLKVLTDRLEALPPPRHVAFYTTSFTVGSALSFWIVGSLDTWLDWRTVVAVTAVGPVVASLVVWGLIQPVAVRPHAAVDARAHVSAVLRSRAAVRYVIGYAAHVWELFALRAWIVPFIVFCERMRGSSSPLPVATLASLVALVGVPASIAGAELTGRHPRRRIIVTVMLLSIAASVLVVPAALLSWEVVIVAVIGYSALISADSAALTSGIIDVAPESSRGTAMAIYSTLGFAAASAGTFAVGVTLDILGGQSARNWMIAFVLMSAPGLVGAVAVADLWRPRTSSDRD